MKKFYVLYHQRKKYIVYYYKLHESLCIVLHHTKLLKQGFGVNNIVKLGTNIYKFH